MLEIAGGIVLAVMFLALLPMLLPLGLLVGVVLIILIFVVSVGWEVWGVIVIFGLVFYPLYILVRKNPETFTKISNNLFKYLEYVLYAIYVFVGISIVILMLFGGK